MPLAPIDADAEDPIARPTKIMSTVLSSCWIRLPRKSGIAKRTRRLAIGPDVRSLIYAPRIALTILPY